MPKGIGGGPKPPIFYSPFLKDSSPHAFGFRSWSSLKLSSLPLEMETRQGHPYLGSQETEAFTVPLRFSAQFHKHNKLKPASKRMPGLRIHMGSFLRGNNLMELIIRRKTGMRLKAHSLQFLMYTEPGGQAMKHLIHLPDWTVPGLSNSSPFPIPTQHTRG